MGLLNKLFDSEPVDVTGPASGSSSNVDNLISEVEVYIAYGLEKKAKETLTTALNDYPDNAKLLALKSKV